MTAIAATPVQTLRVADLHPTLFNPRSPDVAKAAGLPVSVAFSEEKLRALGASIASPTGQLEAILVRPHPTKPGAYEVADGERRYRAAVLCGIETLAAKVRDLSDAEMVEIALAHGTGDHVESLTALEEAAGYKRLKELRAFSDRQLAEHLRRPVVYVTRRLALLELPSASAKALQAGELPPRTAYLIASIPGENERIEAEKSILKSEIHGGVMSYRAACEFIADKVCRALKSPPFDLKDATLIPEAGACTGCRFRAGNNPEEYGDVFGPEKGGGVDKCMHPACYRKKEEAHRARVVTKLAVDGKQALTPEENARAFPADERGLHYSSEFVPYDQRPTPDLLKKEVAPSSAPTWRELVESGDAKAKVQIYVGVHQDGHAIDLVKRHEAIAAADVNERRIFAETEVKRAAERLERGDSIAAADRAAQHETRQRDLAAENRAAQEKAEAEARKKAEKAQKKKDKASRGLLAELFKALCAKDDNKRAAWQGYPAQSLLFEALRDTLTDEEIAYAVEACDEWSVDADHNRDGLNDLSSRLTGDQLGALNLILALVPRWRAQGADGELAKLWAREIIAGNGDLAGCEGPARGPDEVYPPERLVHEIETKHGLTVDLAGEVDFPDSLAIYRGEAFQGTLNGPRAAILNYLNWLASEATGTEPDPENAGSHEVEFIPAPLAFTSGQIVEWGHGHTKGQWGWWYPEKEAEKVTGETFTDPMMRMMSAVVVLERAGDEPKLLIYEMRTDSLRPVDAWEAEADFPGSPEAALFAAKNPLRPEPVDHGVGPADRARQTRKRRAKEKAALQAGALTPEELKSQPGAPAPEPSPAAAAVMEHGASKAAKLVEELIGYDNAGKSLEEMAYLTHLSKADVLQILRAQGRGKDLEASPLAEHEAALKELASVFAQAFPGTNTAAGEQILAKYIKRVAKKVKPREELTAEEARKIVAILQQALAAKPALKGKPTAEPETEKEAA